MEQRGNEGVAFLKLVTLLIICTYLILLHVYLAWDAVTAADMHIRHIVSDMAERDRLGSDVSRCPMHPWQQLYEGRASAQDTTQPDGEGFLRFTFRNPRGIAISRDYLNSLPDEWDLPYPGRFNEDSLDYTPQPAYVGTLVCPDCQDIAIILREVRSGNYLVLDTVWRVPEFRIYIDPDGPGDDDEHENHGGGSDNTDGPVQGSRL